jgi:hypothetical protein
MPPADAGVEVGGKPIVTADAGAVATDEAGRWGRDGTLFSIWEEHCRTKLPQHSTSLLPCGRGMHHPQ